ncbi:winged helix-turn-helix transcriptional regulator [Acidianus brierleyi]|uniref:Lrp/AsnC family transcriptional regulator n=1 Tax=Acidianus brierleyi TaxID=41673 RepID=A0A2U9IJ54_9CREN|nr:winged helix-turn-helix transcriptional regulator [Acidianus brierleyi]
MDELDLKILKRIQKDGRYNLQDLSNEFRIPKSTILYRIRRMEKDGIITGYYTGINVRKLGYDYLVITLIKSKYGKEHYDNVAKELSKLPGVWGVYFVLGNIDFIVMARFKNREDFMTNYLNKITTIKGIQSSNTHIILDIAKDNFYEIF